MAAPGKVNCEKKNVNFAFISVVIIMTVPLIHVLYRTRSSRWVLQFSLILNVN